MDVSADDAKIMDPESRAKILAPHNIVKGIPMNSFLTFLDGIGAGSQAVLLKDFTLSDLALFSQTCRFIYSVIDSYSKKHRDITRTLSTFIPVEHIPRFRVLQADTGLLIGGTTALKFVNWQYKDPKEPTFRLFVHHIYAVRVTEWFVGIGSQHSMSTYLGQTTQAIYDSQTAKLDALPSPPFLDEIDETTFCGTAVCDSRPARRDTAASIAAGDARVNVYAATALSGILSMSTSTMMNFISAHNAYCLFPHETLKKNVVAWLHDIYGYYLNKHREGNSKKAWKRVTSEAKCSVWRVFDEGLRCISGLDGQCLQIPLDTDGLGLDDRHESVLEESSFFFGFVTFTKGPAFVSYDSWYKFQESDGTMNYYRMVKETD
ncbi:hypothetical protein ONZ45_g17423 [Pleurotus djamor]|nr:hypothetical protein ONZ45_g17423 [Pleurotus djamor]